MQARPLEVTHTVHASAVLSGPFEGLAHVTGRMPAWLHGRLVRTAPAVFEQNGWWAHHWFDALGMLYSFEVESPTRVRWAQRLLASDVALAARRGEAPYASFGSPDGRPLLRRLTRPVAQATDNTNVNVVPMGPDWVVMTETERQLRVDPETLETLGHLRYSDALPGHMWMTAHPQWDVARGRVVNVGTVVGAVSEFILYSHAPGSRERVVEGRWRTRRLPYVHSFGLCADAAVLIAHPFDVNPLSLLWSKKPFVSHYAWRPEAGTRLVVIDRATGEAREHETDRPFFCFHTVNTFREGEELVMDLLAYPDASALTEDMRVERMAERLPALCPRLTRVRMARGRRLARTEVLSEVPFEFPTLHHARHSGRPYGVVFGASIDGSGSLPTSSVVRVDVGTGKALRHADPGFVFGEPLFVASPEAQAEDDGVLLTVGSSSVGGSAKLTVLDARTLGVVAEAHVPVALPLGFHGSFARAHTREV